MRYFLIVLGTIAVLGGLVAVKALQIGKLIDFGQKMQEAGPPATAVASAVAEPQLWPRTTQSVGSVVSAQGVTISNDAPGVVRRLALESGARVTRGEVLAELDSRVERAQLNSTRARLTLAEQSLKRTQALLADGAATRSELDADRSAFNGLKAEAAALEARIERAIVRAPFSGRLGLRRVNLGQYLAPGTPLAELESERGLFVDFSLPKHEVARLSLGDSLRLLESATGNELAKGKVAAIEPSANPATRMVQVRADAEESDALHPGMFVRVEVGQGEPERVVAVPATAVVHAPYGDSVFLIEPELSQGASEGEASGSPRLVAVQQFVRLGRRRGDFVSVRQGVEPGARVVSAGAFKLRNGAPVQVSEGVGQAPSLEPRPENR